MSQDTLVHLDPSEILADSNIRFGLKPYKVNSMAQSIIDTGGIMEPVEVEPLDPPVDGQKYRLTFGFIRHAGATKVNNDMGGNVLVPAIVRKPTSTLDRLTRQAKENLDRENMSPMDTARLIKALLDEGMDKLSIRKLLSRPGGRKGLTMEMVSNSFINKHVQFLDFPKAIQNKLHDGTLTVGAGFELTTLHKDKWQDVVTKAEESRLKSIDKDEAEEKKFLDSQKKVEEAEQKATTAATELEKAKAALEAAKAAEAATTEAMKAAFADTLKKDLDKAAKEKAKDELKAAQKLKTDAEKAAGKLAEEVTKLEEKAKTAAETAKEKLTAARLASDAKKAAAAAKAATAPAAAPAKVGARDVKKAAAVTPGATKTPAKNVQLNAKEMREVIDQLALPAGREKVQKIGLCIQAVFNGTVDPKKLGKAIAEIVGEK